MAVSKFFETNIQYLKKRRNTSLFWITDSYCNFLFMSQGSRHPLIQQMIFKIKQSELKMGIRLYPIWQPRSDQNINFADMGTRLAGSSDEWGVSNQDYQLILNELNVLPSLDCFASSSNNKCNVFFSALPQKGASALDFFVQELTIDQCYFLCPPIKVISKTIQRILIFPGISGILLVPKWKSRPYWALLSKYSSFSKSIKKVFTFKATFVSNTKDNVFNGKKDFEMCAFLFKVQR